MREIAPGPQTRVLDVGFANNDNSPVENYIEKHYPYPGNLTALGVDPCDDFAQRYPRVRVVRYDGGTFPFADQQFDVCWSNAVLEHVGGPQRQVQFLREIKRVARRAFVASPNRLFPVEVHTFTLLLHYLPKSVLDAYLRQVGKGWATGDYMRLLSYRDLRLLLEEAGVVDYRIFRNRLAGFTLDFVVIFGADQVS